MRLPQIVILTLILVYPDDVLSGKGPKSRGKKPDPNGPCGKRYLRQINGKCYYFPQKKLNWFGAQNNCLRKELYLADLSAEEEFNGVMDFLRSRGNMDDYWFGGNDLQTEGRFTYISTGRPVRYFGGIENIEPTLRSNLDDCLEVRLRSNSTTVSDENCQEKQHFVCQQNLAKCVQPMPEEKPNEHHSHEHLHHFHHDPSKTEANDDASKSIPESEETDSRQTDDSKTAEKNDEKEEENTSTQLDAQGKEPETDTEGESSTTVVPDEGNPEEESETPAPAPGEDETPSPDGEPTEPEAGEGETPAPETEGEETPAPAAEGEEAPAPAAEGEEAPAPAAEGEESPAPAAEGEEAPAPAAEGEEAPAAEGEEAPAAEGEEAPGADGEEHPATEGGEAPPPEGEEAPTAEGEEAPAAEGEEAPATEGEEPPAPPAEGEEAPETAPEEAMPEADEDTVAPNARTQPLAAGYPELSDYLKTGPATNADSGQTARATQTAAGKLDSNGAPADAPIAISNPNMFV